MKIYFLNTFLKIINIILCLLQIILIRSKKLKIKPCMCKYKDQEGWNCERLIITVIISLISKNYKV